VGVSEPAGRDWLTSNRDLTWRRLAPEPDLDEIAGIRGRVGSFGTSTVASRSPAMSFRRATMRQLNDASRSDSFAPFDAARARSASTVKPVALRFVAVEEVGAHDQVAVLAAPGHGPYPLGGPHRHHPGDRCPRRREEPAAPDAGASGILTQVLTVPCCSLVLAVESQ
jgi:hypothetical protein